MTPQQLNQIAAAYECIESDIENDGILNPDLYAACGIKVLWILKEAWFKDSWRIMQGDGVYAKIGGSPTLQPIAYIMHSIFNGFPSFQEMEYIRANPEIAESLRRIAFINAKKTIGGPRSDDKDVWDHYLLAKVHILEQIEAISPDVIIGCAPHFPDLFKTLSDADNFQKFESVEWGVSRRGQLLIYAYHPQQTKINRADYINDIVQLIKTSRADPVAPPNRESVGELNR
jgi:hypothetical protein